MGEKLDKETLKQARIDFFALGKIDTPFARKDILDSWIRSKGYKLNPETVQTTALSSAELEARIKKNHLLYNVSVPLMKTFYSFFEDSGFMLSLADSDGYILKILGDKDIVNQGKAQENPFIEGVNRHEHTVGTNAIGTCLVLKKPIQVWANEHFYSFNQHWSCSGAPIFGDDNKLLGILCLSGTWDKVTTHTLAMVTAAATAIAKQFQLQKAYSSLQQTTHKLQTAIDSLTDGILLVDSQLTITQVNMRALSMLDMTSEQILKQPVHGVLPNIDFKSLTKNSYDIETQIVGNGVQVNAFLSIKQIVDKSLDTKTSFIVIFRAGKHVHKLANKLMGSNAHFTFSDIIGEAPAIKEAKHIAHVASKSSSNVLLIGGSGTGKELFAQSIHNNSSYANGPFIAINCGALPRSLIESELFGYTGGSFTGAKKEGQPGKFELANGGTIFLDEIGDMPYDVQVSLLRILQTKEITRIGGKKAIPIDVRIIAATNVDLEEAIENKTFRSDLFYRLNVLNIKIPSLSDRENDILLLSEYFINKCQATTNHSVVSIHPSVKQVFLNYSWPGNIRELENTIERACLLSETNEITLDCIPGKITESATMSEAQSNTTFKPINLSATSSIDETEKQLIINHLIAEKGNIKKAADSLKMSRRTLYRKLDRYNIDYQTIRITKNL